MKAEVGARRTGESQSKPLALELHGGDGENDLIKCAAWVGVCPRWRATETWLFWVCKACNNSSAVAAI